MGTPPQDIDTLARDVRIHVFGQAAATGSVPQAREISRALKRSEDDVRSALRALAAAKALILTPNDSSIWIAPPFCAVPSGFRVAAGGKNYWGICIWDALGVAAAVGKDAVITTSCGDCADKMTLEIRDNALVNSEGVVHFGVRANRWWDNIGFT